MSACTSEVGSLAISLRHTYPHVSLHTRALRAVCATVLMASELAALAVHRARLNTPTALQQSLKSQRLAGVPGSNGSPGHYERALSHTRLHTKRK